VHPASGDVLRVPLVEGRHHLSLEEPIEGVRVHGVLRVLADEGTIRGWRGEDYPISTAWGALALLRMERAAVPFFGATSYGVHLNGYVRDGGRLLMWIGRRARDKHTYPGMLDNMVAGGQPIGLSLRENLIKECAEEAAIPRPLAERAVPVGAISYRHQTAEGLKPDVQFCYDLEVPADFVPRNTDGEIESFVLLPIDEVARIVAETRDFKFNCNLVVIDFLVRHGVLDPERPDYLPIVRALHR
jgi:isopentenyldiphosphate isomerase